ncbi:MAG TPA: hypothetical protein VH439_17190 [Gemmatimonadales bacterium]|jgi:hypothetical protein
MDVSLTKPHAKSAYAHLPLRASEATAVKVTREDRARYAERPLTLLPSYRVLTDAEMRAARDTQTLTALRDTFVSLNISDETSGAEQERVPCIDSAPHHWRVGRPGTTSDFWQDTDAREKSFTCARCGAIVEVGAQRIASTPKIPCPYAARNRREDQASKLGQNCPLRKGDSPSKLSTSETDTTATSFTTSTTNGVPTMPKTIKTTKTSKSAKLDKALERATALAFNAPAPVVPVVEAPAPVAETVPVVVEAPVVEAPVVECCAHCGQRIRKPSAPRKSGTYAASSLANPELAERRKQAGFKAAATLRAKREAAALAAQQQSAA